MTLSIQLAAPVTDHVRAVLARLLEGCDFSIASEDCITPLAILLNDIKQGQPVGGLWAMTGGGYMSIAGLFVPAGFRGRGLGSRMLEAAEQEGARRGCLRAHMMTSESGCRVFLHKRGFQPIGEVFGRVPSASTAFMGKTVHR